MAATNDVKIRILVDGKQVDVSLDELKAKLKETGEKGKGSGESISGGMKIAYLGAMAAIGAFAGLTAAISKAVNVASDMNEENSKFGVVFGEAGAKADEFREKLTDAYFMSDLEATKLMASTGDLLTGFGATRDEAAELSFAVQAMAADLVSFKNIEGGVKAASDALTKALLGERESAKMLGIAINEEDVKQELNRMGKAKAEGQALKLAKAQATLNLIYKSQANAIGDLERTSDSYANQQRKMGAAWENLSIQIGQIFMPIFSALIGAMSDAIKWFSAFIDVWVGLAREIGLAKEALVDYYDTQGKLKTAEAQARLEELSRAIFILSGNLDDAKERLKASPETMGRFATGFTGATGEVYRLEKQLKEMRTEYNLLEKALSKPIVIKTPEAEKEVETEEDRKKLEKEKELLIAAENEKLDLLYDYGKISNEEYDKILQARLAKAAEIYGADSSEYMKMSNAILKIAEEREKALSDAQEKAAVEWVDRETDKFEKSIAAEQEKIDLQYEFGEISNANYDLIMQTRLANTAMIYGKESQQYVTMSNQMLRTAKSREKQEQQARQQTAQMAMDAGSALVNALAGQSRKAFEVAKAYNIAKAIIDAIAGANAALKNALLPPPLNVFAAMATLAYGYANVAQIKSQKYTGHAEGGIVDRPMMGLIGEAGEPEIIAPKKNFIEVTNELINRGEIGGGDLSAIIERLEILNQTMINLKLEASLDPRGMSIVVEKGNKLITGSRF